MSYKDNLNIGNCYYKADHNGKTTKNKEGKASDFIKKIIRDDKTTPKKLGLHISQTGEQKYIYNEKDIDDILGESIVKERISREFYIYYCFHTSTSAKQNIYFNELPIFGSIIIKKVKGNFSDDININELIEKAKSKQIGFRHPQNVNKNIFYK